MISKFKTVLLLGSTKSNETLFRNAESLLTKQGYIVMAPVLYGAANCAPYLDMLTEMCESKCAVCDMCVIVTPKHIGPATAKRIAQARDMGKPVYVFDTNEPGYLREYKPYGATRKYKTVMITDDNKKVLCMLRVKNYDDDFNQTVNRAKDIWRAANEKWDDILYPLLKSEKYIFDVVPFEPCEVI